MIRTYFLSIIGSVFRKKGTHRQISKPVSNWGGRGESATVLEVVLLDDAARLLYNIGCVDPDYLRGPGEELLGESAQ